ncbi:MAG: hypothetical protein KAS04_03390 [Candidatus Aenigmarchaeota archaeon]|nr:hypothetical protein [Candidatus Aenigmarchaeota archaeon]
MNKKMFAVGISFLALSMVLTVLSITPTTSSYDLPKIEKEWTCTNGGFSSAHCYTQDCAYNVFHVMEREGDQIFNFDAPMAGEYECTIEVVGNHFGYKPDTSPQLNERADVFLNNEKVGTTEDPWCDPDPGGTIIGGVVGCVTSPKASSVDKHNCSDTIYYGKYFCDDDRMTLALGHTLVVDLTLCTGTAFVKDGKNLAHCQAWKKYSNDPAAIKAAGNCELSYSGQTVEGIGGTIIWIKECDGNQREWEVHNAVPGKSYSVGSFSKIVNSIVTTRCKLGEPTGGHCSDGTKNYDETGIDCGGSSCPSCGGTTGECNSNNVLDPGEECDITKLGSKRCTDVIGPDGKYEGGSLGCQNDPNYGDKTKKTENICEFDTIYCFYTYEKCSTKVVEPECRTYTDKTENKEDLCQRDEHCEPGYW